MPNPRPSAESTVRTSGPEEPSLALQLAELKRRSTPWFSPRWWRGFWLVVFWAYLAAVAAVWLLIRGAGDRWWLATVLTFAPRWAWLLPLLVLVPAALLMRRRRRSLLPLLLGGLLVVLGPMGLCVPWRGWFAGEGPALRVVTCNVEGENAGLAALRSLIVKIQPDVVALQECPGWPAEDLQRLFPDGWQVQRGGSLLVASPHPIVETQTHQRSRPPSRWPAVNGLYCVIDSPQGRLGICSVHQRTPRPGLYIVLDRHTGLSAERSRAVTEETALRRMEAEDLAAWVQARDVPTVVAGDFNMPVDSGTYRDCWGRLANAFSQAGWGFGSTKLTRLHGVLYGLRIDHVLVPDPWQPRRAWVAPSVGSDHLPLVAEVGRM